MRRLQLLTAIVLVAALFALAPAAQAQTRGTIQDAIAGTLTITLTTPSSSLDAGNRVSVDVTYQGTEGGSWVRDDVAIQRLTLGRE